MENEMRNSYHSGHSKGLAFGFALMIIGLLFLGVNFGFISPVWKHIVISWPMLLIFIGVVHVFKRHFVSAAVLILAGAFFLAPRIMPELQPDFVKVFWPVLLIVAGALILTHRLFCPNTSIHTCNNWSRHENRRNNYRKQARWEANKDGFTKNTVFGSGEHIVLDPVFKGGELNAVFGGITLDLRRTSLPEGETHLDVNAVFGGVTIFIPSNWSVETHLDAVFGGFQDNRMIAETIDSTRKLIITGSCVFGGGEIRN